MSQVEDFLWDSPVWQDRKRTSDIVKYYRSCGLNVMPLRVDGSKAPKIRWAQYQLETIPEDELTPYFYSHNPSGIGVICGSTSGNLEVIDFDSDLYHEWADDVDVFMEGDEWRDSLVIIDSPSDGTHIYYRCDEIAGNLKLAYLHSGKIAIETRGQGGQTAMPGSPAATHRLNRRYRLARGAFHAIPTIPPWQRKAYHDVARRLCRRPPTKEGVLAEYYPESFSGSVKGDRPGDDWNVSGKWSDVLEPAGYTFLSGSGGVGYWQRPGKHRQGTSCTTGHCETPEGLELMYVFSTNAAPLEGGKSYTKFTALAWLQFGGDFHAASEYLASLGYGRASLTRSEEEINQFFKEYDL